MTELLKLEAQLLSQHAIALAPHVSNVPEVAQRFRSAFARIIVDATMKGGVLKVLPTGTPPKPLAAQASYSAISSKESSLGDEPGGVQAWFRAWRKELEIPGENNDEEFLRDIASQTAVVRSKILSTDMLLASPASIAIPHLFDALIQSEEKAFADASKKKAIEAKALLPIPKQAHFSKKDRTELLKLDARHSIGSSNNFHAPKEPTLKGRLHLMQEHGGSRRLAAQYIAEILHLPLEGGHAPAPAEHPKPAAAHKPAAEESKKAADPHKAHH